MRFLTPLAALVALAALLPLGAAALGRLRVRAVRRELGLQPPPRWRGSWRLGTAAFGIAVLGLAAAQPALTNASSVRERTDVAALFLIDTSRSMSASTTPASPTRLERAVAAAVRLRAAIPDVPAGVATMTDRVLPDLLPVPDAGGFDGVVRRAVAIDSPPPAGTSVVATNYAVLSGIASANYFEPGIKRRIVVLLTDGESNPFDPSYVASALPASQGYRFVGVRFWNANEQVYDSAGRAEPGYHPNPAGGALISELAAAMGGRSFSESEVSAAASYLRALTGSGPTVTSGDTVRSQQTLAPFVAVLAVLLLLAAVAPASGRGRAWFRQRAGRNRAPAPAGRPRRTAARDVTGV